MRRPVLVAVVGIIVLLLVSSGVLFSKLNESNKNYADMKAAEETARMQYAEAFNSIAEIQDSLNAISVTEGSVRLQPQSLAAEQRLTEPDRQQVLESIALLNASIQRTKDRIGLLETNLKKSGNKVAGLERMVSRLKASVKEREETVAQLTGQVEQLTVQVQAGQEEIAVKNQVIEEKRRELGTVAYVIGTKQELTKSGVIEAKGGVLGLGKTVKLTGNFNEQIFTTIDTDQETVIRVPGTTKVQVLSPQPVTSYQVVVEGDQVALRILDPVAFRKVKHVVIMTA